MILRRYLMIKFEGTIKEKDGQVWFNITNVKTDKLTDEELNLYIEDIEPLIDNKECDTGIRYLI